MQKTSQNLPERVYITTPIYYVNAAPHIGTAYTTLVADTLARYWRSQIGRERVRFTTGTDENSQKTVEAAQKAGQSVPEYLDKMARQFVDCWAALGIDYDDFVRTTEPRHHATVTMIVNQLKAADAVYLGDYRGLYCTGCEAFKKESDLTPEGHCPDHNRAPQVIEEQNYFFRLTAFVEPLRELLQSGWMQPQKRANELLSLIESGLEDISMTRAGAQIGIPYPADPEQKLYVWVEALMNYYTSIDTPELREFWPFAEHLIGKDITRFHCLIWPAMLMSAGYPLPKSVFAHGFFTINGTKMSKSLGNVIDPVEMAQTWGRDALRVGVLSAFVFGNDGDFSLATFQQTYDTKLAGGLGNLVHRVVTLINKYYDGAKPQAVPHDTPELTEFHTAMQTKDVFGACGAFFTLIDRANKTLTQAEPWRAPDKHASDVTALFAELLTMLDGLCEMSQSLLPETYSKLKEILGDAAKVGTSTILFPRVELPETSA